MLNEGNERATPDGKHLRLLIQQVQTGSGKSWRLIVYGDGERYPAPEFASFEALLAVLRDRVPDLDLSNIGDSVNGSSESILYAADVRLTDAQRTALGLISAAGKSGAGRT